MKKNNLFLYLLFTLFLLFSIIPNTNAKFNVVGYGEVNNEKAERQLKVMKSIVENKNNLDENGLFKQGNYSSIVSPNQLQLFEDNKILSFFLAQIRSYFSSNGYDPIYFQKYINSICDLLLICKIPVLGDGINFVVDMFATILEAQCYRDWAEHRAQFKAVSPAVKNIESIQNPDSINLIPMSNK